MGLLLAATGSTSTRAGITAAAVEERPASGRTSGYAGSASCRECHARFYELWSASFHGLAMQPYSAGLAKAKLTPQAGEMVEGPLRFRADIEEGLVIERTPTNEARYTISQVMGGKNVFYFLTPLERGKLQVLPVAYDTRRKEWFDTTASAMRHFGDHRDEALFWKDRQLTFNTSCFNCHVSQLSKNYDIKSDSYHTTWAEPGINCETCHGPSAEHARLFKGLVAGQSTPRDLKLIVFNQLGIEERNAACASCHAKMSPVTMSFVPGEHYFDHFDLVTLESPDFYPDGRDLGENYTYTQWRLSSCAKSGTLDCIHCHTSSGAYRFKNALEGNNACLPCHEDRVRNAPSHSHHAAGTAGNLCVSCHMPATEFARMRRTDHSMRPPAPAATVVYQSPNACNLCHTNQEAAWADKFVRQWSSRDYEKSVLERAALIAAARKGDWSKLPDILGYLTRADHEEIHTASLVRLLGACPSDAKWPVLQKLAHDPSPLVRASVVEALGERLDEGNASVLLESVGDEVRLVRVRAAAALAPIPEANVPEARRGQVRRAMVELIESLKSHPDDIASHYNLGNLEMARNRMTDAVTEFEAASRLSPEAMPPYVNAALAYNALGQNEKAEACLRRALSLDATNGPAQLNLGMLLAEMGRYPEAEQAFREAFRVKAQSAQAARNLGVLLWKDRPGEALDWCRRAAALAPENPQYGYTYAFYLDLAGRAEEALEAIRSVCLSHPEDTESRELERALLRKLGPAEK